VEERGASRVSSGTRFEKIVRLAVVLCISCAAAAVWASVAVAEDGAVLVESDAPAGDTLACGDAGCVATDTEGTVSDSNDPALAGETTSGEGATGEADLGAAEPGGSETEAPAPEPAPSPPVVEAPPPPDGSVAEPPPPPPPVAPPPPLTLPPPVAVTEPSPTPVATSPDGSTAGTTGADVSPPPPPGTGESIVKTVPAALVVVDAPEELASGGNVLATAGGDADSAGSAGRSGPSGERHLPTPGSPKPPPLPREPSAPSPGGGGSSGGSSGNGLLFSGFAALVAVLGFGAPRRLSRRLIPSVAVWQPVALVSPLERPG
jgi:hypothetical protein